MDSTDVQQGSNPPLNGVSFNEKELGAAIEAVLFAAGDPVPIAKLCALFELDRGAVEAALKGLADYYQFERRGIYLLQLEDSFQLATRAEYGGYVRRVIETGRAPTLSPQALEALSIVAYRQPVTRAMIDQIRGVDSSNTVASLAEKGLIAECGRLDVPGRPILYATTDAFLRSFGLSSLDELPELPDLIQPDDQITFAETIEPEEPGGEGA